MSAGTPGRRVRRKPYRVRYAWSDGPSGVVVKTGEDEAKLAADGIERAAYGHGKGVTIEVCYVTPHTARGGKGVVIERREITTAQAQQGADDG